MDYEFLFHLSVCFLLSFLIGIERQYRRRTIGLRTTILVSVGCFMFVTFSFSVGAADVSRIASQIVAGIGFLGAGVILKDGKKVTGLTTAATLWCVAAIGVLCAGGAIFESIVGGSLILFSNIGLRYVNIMVDNISKKNNCYYNYNLKIACNSKYESLLQEELNKFIKSKKIENISIKIKKELNEIIYNYEFKILEKNKNYLDEIVYKLELLKVDNFELNKIIDSKNEEFDI